MMLVLSVVLLALVHTTLVDSSAVIWNYETNGPAGPKYWYQNYQDCGGVMQSPIDIETYRVVYDKTLKPFDLSDYEITQGVEMELVNKGGHTAEVVFTGTPMYLTGGSLPARYRLAQFHFHWGNNDNKGSEHALDGLHFPMELHIVHYQARFDNISEAAPKPSGLAVLGFFIKVGEKNNTNFDSILKYFGQIRDADTDESVIIDTFKLSSLLPTNTNFNYYRYSGSLTTPPCSETVIWSLATEPLLLSESQIDEFRSLFDAERHVLVNDFRPVQDLHDRTVTTTLKPDTSTSTASTNAFNSNNKGPGDGAAGLTASLISVAVLLVVSLSNVL